MKFLKMSIVSATLALVCASPAFAVKPCDQDAGDCASKRVPKNTAYEGSGGTCVVVTNGVGSLVAVDSAASCAQFGGTWSPPRGGPGPGGGKPDGGNARLNPH